ncbi:MAG: glycoside hydrolase family 130 protein [Flavobacteriaceae bacterium]|nr:glycoside hydrolase family 130 protein [Flavobacteriaceae bacterium]
MKVNRSNTQIKANSKRVIINYLDLGANTNNTSRANRLIDSVLSIPEKDLNVVYEEVKNNFKFRHRNFEHHLKLNFKKVEHILPSDVMISEIRSLVIGAYFSKEYSIQSAALFNPSVVPHPNQKGLKEGEKRFVLSLRSVGEGHISSIEFRSGIVDADGNISLDKETGFSSCSEKYLDKVYHKENILKNTAVLNDFNQSILEVFENNFTYKDYLEKEKSNYFSTFNKTTQEQLFHVLDTNYDVITDANASICERVIFPNALGESMGMEDVRFVAFTNNEKTQYIGTYTAYNGYKISPQLILTEDFIHFKARAMYGAAVSDKGMALFPEKIDGKYVMIGRQGGENITIMYSDDLFIWEDYEVIMTPKATWSYVQLGNCGSPIKTNEGWLVITHAVGPLRKYVLGAILLDLKNPSKIIKRLNKPLLSPNEEEREGYVPNVVYSCGSMAHEGNLILPYAMSDSASTFATINIEELLNEMDIYESKSEIKYVV